jgi:hypothetical protein
VVNAAFEGIFKGVETAKNGVSVDGFLQIARRIES